MFFFHCRHCSIYNQRNRLFELLKILDKWGKWSKNKVYQTKMGIRSEIFDDSLFCVVDSFPTHKFADVNQPTEKNRYGSHT